VAISRIQTEKDKLLKKKGRTDAFLKRAKARPEFPAAIDHCQQTNEEEESELRRLDEGIRQHESHYHQLEKTLKARLGPALSLDSPKSEAGTARLEKESEEKITKLRNEWEGKLTKYQNDTEGRFTKLEAEIDRARAAAVDAEKRATQAGNMKKTLTDAVTSLQDKVELLEKPGANRSTPVHNAPNSGLNQEIASQVQPMNQLKEEIDGLKQHVTTLDSVTQPLVQFKPHCLKMFDELNGASADQREKIEGIKANTFEPLRKRLENIDIRIDGLLNSNNANSEAGVVSADVMQRIEKLESDVPKTLDNIMDRQNTLDGLQTEELKGVQRTLSEQSAEQFKSLKEGYSHVSVELKNLGDANMTAKQNITGLWRILETVRTGLQSLENRWNNLSTEPIVKNMAAAMQEMYPSTGQLHDQIAALKTDMTKSINPIRDQTNRLSHSRGETIQQVQRVSAQIGEVAKLRQDLTSLGESFNTLRKDVQLPAETLGQLRSNIDDVEKRVNDTLRYDVQLPAETLGQLRANLEGVEKRVNEHAAELERLGSKGTADAEAIQRLEDERGALDREVKKLAQQGADLASEVKDAVAGTAKNTYDVSAHTAEIQAFGDRVFRVEESASAIKAETATQEGSIGSRMQLLEDSTTEKAQTLRDELDQLKRALESRQRDESRPRPPLATPSLQQSETNQAPALLEEKKKKKKKRPRTDDDKESVQGTPGMRSVEETPLGEHGEKRKKKKKRSTLQDEAAEQ
jgi:chromosome segregation ATPase